MSSLRHSILTHALPLVSSHSFTRAALRLSLSSLPSSHTTASDSAPIHTPDADSVLDTLFGPGAAGGRALVERWEKAGVEEMFSVSVGSDQGSGAAGPGTLEGKGKGKGTLEHALRRRLAWSARVGEHLVEAYALFTAPGSATSLPLPSVPTSLLSSALAGLRLPPTYSPPNPDHPAGPASHRPTSTPTSTPYAGDALSSLLQRAGGRLPLLSFNPLGPLGYAWRIADTALAVSTPREVKTGVMSEPVGSGPEYYTSRLALSMGYLMAESHLLQPLPAGTPEGTNPHLHAATESLGGHLRRYKDLASTIEGAEGTAGGVAGYLQFVERSTAGILRSRGW